jgi:hypothetical protein
VSLSLLTALAKKFSGKRSSIQLLWLFSFFAIYQTFLNNGSALSGKIVSGLGITDCYDFR